MSWPAPAWLCEVATVAFVLLPEFAKARAAE